MFSWIKSIRQHFHAQQRKMDIDVLWPSCKQQSPDSIHRAKDAFALHAFYDSAWMPLGRKEIQRQIDALE